MPNQHFGIYLLLLCSLCCSLDLPLNLGIGLLPVDANGPTKSLEYTPYYKASVCSPSSPIQYPINIEEVLGIVNDAIQNGNTVKAIGALHSITDIVCTNGVPISMRGIQDKIMHPDFTVTFGAGVNVHDASEFLKAYGRALRTLPGFGNITIGGAIGTGAHGSSLRYTSTISEQVIGLTIINGLGELQEITEIEELNAFRVHLGLLGIIVLVKLGTEPLYKVRGENYVIPDISLFNGDLLNTIRNIDQVSVYWFPSFEKLVIANWTIVDVTTPGEAWTNDHVPSTYSTFDVLFNPLLETIQALESVTLMNFGQEMMMDTLFKQVPNFPPIYTKDGNLLENPAVGYPNQMFSPICYEVGFAKCPWAGPFPLTQLDIEMGIELGNLPDVAHTVKDIVTKYSAVFPFQGILLRFSSASDSYMSTAFHRDTCHFEFYVPTRYNPYNDPSLSIGAFQTILQSLAFNYSARTHWGKTGSVYHSSDMLTMNLDERALSAFLKSMDTYDPNGLFLNDFGARLKGTGTAINNDPLVTRCALLDNCFCSSKRDCAANQVCGTLTGYPKYRSCINRNSSPSSLDKDLILPANFSFLTDIMSNTAIFTL